MKNKIVSAMLFGMTASMMIPGITTFAEDESTGLQTEQTGTTGNGASEGKSEGSESSDDANAGASADSDANTEQEAEGASEQFAEKLSSIIFDSSVFGDYATELQTHVLGLDTSNFENLGDVEKDVAEAIEEKIAANADVDVQNALKYQMLLVFEKAYGDTMPSAIEAGREIRCSILSNEDVDSFAEGLTTTSEIDAEYKSKASAITKTPVEILTEKQTEESEETGGETSSPIGDLDSGSGADTGTGEGTDTGADTGTGEGTDAGADTGTGDGTDAGADTGTGEGTDTGADTGTSDGAGDVLDSLDKYCQNIKNLEMVAGTEIPDPGVTYEKEKIAAVSLDTSAVNPNVVGVYKIIYTITGSNAKTEKVEMQCRVTENAELTALRNEMRAKIDAIEAAKDITVDYYKAEWDKTASAAKEKINILMTEEEMQAVVDEATETASTIRSAQQLYVAQTGYVKLLKEYRNGLSLTTNAQQTQADAAVDTAVKAIEAATTVDDAAKALEEGKAALDKIAGEDASSIDALKNDAKTKIKVLAAAINDSTTITLTLQETMLAKIDSCTTAKEIDSITNTANLAFADVKLILEDTTKNLDTFTQLFKDLKGAAPDSDTMDVINEVLAHGTPESISYGEMKVQDICAAITDTKDDFVKYLAKRANVSETSIPNATKKAAYVGYLKVEPEAIVTPKPTEKPVQPTDDTKLKEAKATAKAEIQSIVDAKSNDTIKDALAKLQAAANDKIDSETTTAGVTAAVDEFKTAVDKLTAEEDSELATAKSTVYANLAKLVNDANADYVTTDMKDAISTAQAKALEATSVSDCNSIYDAAKSAFDAAYLASMKSAYSAKLDSLMTDNTFSSDEYKQQAQTIVDKQKSNIEQATSETTMEKCYKLAKTNVEKIAAQTNDTNNELSQAKTTAILKINSFLSSPTTEQVKIIKQYETKINAATTTSEIDSLVSACKTALQNTNANTTDDATTQALIKAKQTAITELSNQLKKDINSNATALCQAYIEKVKNASTVDEVNTLLEAGKTAISNAQSATSNNSNTNSGTNSNTSGSDSTTTADTLSTAKSNAIAKLKAILETVPTAQKEKATELYNSYVTKINAATTTSEVDSIYDEGAKALEALGGNVAAANNATTTTLGNSKKTGETETATAKGVGESAETTGQVKTGDNNTSIIAIAGTTVMAAIGAAFVAMRKLFHK